MTELFRRRIRVTGRRLQDYENLIAIEVINEPAYPDARTLRALESARAEKEKTVLGQEELTLLDLYGRYLAQKGLAPDDENAATFCADQVDRYIRRMFGLVDRYFGSTVLKSHIFYGYFESSAMRCVLEHAPVDCISVHGYAPGNFNSVEGTKPARRRAGNYRTSLARLASGQAFRLTFLAPRRSWAPACRFRHRCVCRYTNDACVLHKYSRGCRRVQSCLAGTT